MKHIPRNLNLPPFWRCLFLWKWCNPFPRARARLKHAHSFDRCGPLAMSNTGCPRFTDFPSLCACSESSLRNLIGCGLNLLCLRIHPKLECRWTWPEVAILGADQKSAASGDKNAFVDKFEKRSAHTQDVCSLVSRIFWFIDKYYCVTV